MAIWINNAGREIETNDSPESAAVVRKAGWVLKGEEPESPANLDARGVPFCDELHTGEKYKNGNWKYVKGMNAKKASKREAELVYELEG